MMKAVIYRNSPFHRQVTVFTIIFFWGGDIFMKDNQKTYDQIRSEIIQTPETKDFMVSVPIEAEHQRQR